MSTQYYMEVRGSMTRFEPLTETDMVRNTQDGLTTDSSAPCMRAGYP